MSEHDALSEDDRRTGTCSKRKILPWDAFFEEGNLICNLNSLHSKQIVLDVDDEQLLHKSHPQFKCQEPNCTATFTSLQSFEIHYSSQHRYVCAQCRRVFPSNHLLSLHISEEHDAYFQSQTETSNDPLFECLVERCKERFHDAAARKEHVVSQHKFPANFKFVSDGSKPKSKTGSAKVTDGTQSSQELANPSDLPGKRYSCRVPQTICFGQGVPRTFQHQSKGKNSTAGKKTGSGKKHWHQQAAGTSRAVDIENVTMTDLQEALE